MHRILFVAALLLLFLGERLFFPFKFKRPGPTKTTAKTIVPKSTNRTNHVLQFSKKKSFLLYVLCYDDRTCDAGKAFFGTFKWSRVVRLPQTVFFETYAFTNIFPDKIIADEWENYDYVGTVSWKAPLKFMENFRFGKLVMSSIVKRAPDDADVIALVGQHLTNYTMLEKASQAHPRFKEVWEGLLGAFNKYTPEEISTEGMTPMLCNYWLARPQHAIKFIDFMKKAHHLMETLPSIQEPLWADAQYVNNTAIARGVFGRDYYTHHPFVLERLTPFFFNTQKLKIAVFKKFRKVFNNETSSDNESSEGHGTAAFGSFDARYLQFIHIAKRGDKEKLALK